MVEKPQKFLTMLMFLSDVQIMNKINQKVGMICLLDLIEKLPTVNMK